MTWRLRLKLALINYSLIRLHLLNHCHQVSMRPIELYSVCVCVCLCVCAQLAIAKNNIIKLQEENQQLRSENSLILLKAQQHFEVRSHNKLKKRNSVDTRT